MSKLVGLDGKALDAAPERKSVTDLLRLVADKIDAGEYPLEHALVLLQEDSGALTFIQSEGLTISMATYLLESAKVRLIMAAAEGT